MSTKKRARGGKSPTLPIRKQGAQKATPAAKKVTSNVKSSATGFRWFMPTGSPGMG